LNVVWTVVLCWIAGYLTALACHGGSLIERWIGTAFFGAFAVLVYALMMKELKK
jgi:hypothetical protein